MNQPLPSLTDSPMTTSGLPQLIVLGVSAEYYSIVDLITGLEL